MNELTLYYMPLTCARVTMVALEETGIAYDAKLVNFLDPPNWAEYLKINSRGKVPALQVGEKLLTENGSILAHLHQQFPDAQLLPNFGQALGDNEPLQDLIWCSATLHPMTRMIRAPARFSKAEDTSAIQALGIEYYQPVLQELETRFKNQKFWFGEDWSIIDVYLNWNYTTAQRGGLDLSAFPAIQRHSANVEKRPSVQSVTGREQADLKSLGFI
ncbi:MAG: hypothetical protein CMK09_04920 [Ponticaulis sp.]|nr:hypothetical protein [Ponticaulis sp.]|tara:strand:- start:27679 stop:28326 length:648 start_codon:yes stop_codon:yes gene_type:complete